MLGGILRDRASQSFNFYSINTEASPPLFKEARTFGIGAVLRQTQKSNKIR
jgi:hypothetical protein